jgi:1-acyl-sn-glycerol-3-phosphate acyltransferase
MSSLKGLVSLVLLVVTTLFWAVPLILLTLLKLITPVRQWRRRMLGGLNGVAQAWVGGNLWWIRHWIRPRVDIRLPEGLSSDQWWLVLANHRSWTDIFLLFMALHRRLPMPRFFIKRQLVWIPVIGLAFWALEFPFLRRYSRQQVQRNPRRARLDRQAIQRMCEHAREMPVAIFNFAEGTRFTPAKQASQQSPYRHLLRPRAGGVAQVVNLLGDRLDGILDVTLHYGDPQPTFWDFLCGRMGAVRLEARRLEVPAWMLEGQLDDPQYKECFHSWLNALWQEKDEHFSQPSS